jgi:hypothetical protein
VAEATVYLTFQTKGALLDAAIVRATRDNPSESLAAIAEGAGLPPDRYAGWLTDTLAAILLRPAVTT